MSGRLVRRKDLKPRPEPAKVDPASLTPAARQRREAYARAEAERQQAMAARAAAAQEAQAAARAAAADQGQWVVGVDEALRRRPR